MGVRSTGSQHSTTTEADGHLLEYFRNTFGAGGAGSNTSPPSGIQATGGVISDYTVGSTVYRAHVFTSSGTFDVSSIGAYGSNVEYLVVAGGGGAGKSATSDRGGGGGAGGFRTNLSGHPLAGSALPVSSSPGSYTVTVGGGGSGANFTGSTSGGATSNGNPSVFSSITSKVVVEVEVLDMELNLSIKMVLLVDQAVVLVS